MLPLGTVEGPELVVGLVGRIGLDTRVIANLVKDLLSAYSYKVEHLKVTALILKSIGSATVDHPIECYYTSRIEACNKLRELSGRNDVPGPFLAMTAILAKSEQLALQRDADALQKRVAYIVDQIKRPGKRQSYCVKYIGISSFKSPAMLRETFGAAPGWKIANHTQRPARGKLVVRRWLKLIGRDDAEKDERNGQRVRDAFPLADIVINPYRDKTAFEEWKSLLRDILRLPYAIPNARRVWHGDGLR